MIRITIFDVRGRKQRMYENLVPVGMPRRGDGANTDLASNQLVQFFLRKFFQKKPGLLPRGTTFLLDGKVGPQTIDGINRFQTLERNAGVPLFLDSRVNVPTGINVPGTGMRWTIHTLNSFFIRSEGEDAFNRLFQNPEILANAPVLAAELALQERLLS